MKKVLVTGATGFIGDYVIGELLKQGYRVTATSFSEAKARSKQWYQNVNYIPFDLSAYSSKTDYFKFFGSPDLMIHLAWEGLPHYKSAFHIEVNLPRHIEFLTNLINHGLKDLTVTGTCFEYGMQEGSLSEDMPALPENVYAAAKDKLRRYLEDITGDKVSFKWVRLFYMYGKGQGPGSLLSQLQAAIDKGDTVFNMSPGDQLRDYLPVETVAEYITRIAGQQKVKGIINCCSGSPMMVMELAKQYIQQKGAKIALNLGHYPYSDIEPKNFWGDTKKLWTIV